MGFDPHLLPSMMKDESLIQDLCRFADGILTEKQVRQRWHLADDDIWFALGREEAFVERIEFVRTQRIRSGATKRELAQLHVTKAPAVLDKILSDERASPKHRIDAAKTLDDLAGFAPQTAAEQERVIIRIDLGADVRAKGGVPGPDDVLVYDCAVQPKTKSLDDETVHNQPHPPRIEQQEPIPPIKRGRGRPPGSKNKPKHAPQKSLPGFKTE
jgi:hypothetical protein